MNIKNELKCYAQKIEDYNALKLESEEEVLELAFKHRKEYVYPMPNDMYNSWEAMDAEEYFEWTTDLPCYTMIKDRHGDYHEVYPTMIYKKGSFFYVDGYDLTDSEWISGWDVEDVHDAVEFITAVLDTEEDDRHFATITYNSKEYWLRQVLSNDGTLLIGDTKLYDTLHPGSFGDDNDGWDSKEAESIDERIFYYVSPDELMLPKEQFIELLKQDNPDLF